MPDLLSSTVVIEEEQPALPQIEGVPTAVAGFVGPTEKGPLDRAVLCQSVDEFRRIFGGYIANSDMAQAIDDFFNNGGKQVYVARVVHYTDASDVSTKQSAKATKTVPTAAIAATSGEVLNTLSGPFDLDPGDTLVFKVDGGGNLTATIAATAASRESGAGTYNLSNGQTLTVSMNGGAVQTVTFLTASFANIAAATPAEVAAVIAAGLLGASVAVTSGGTKVTITSDRKGTSSGVNVTGGSANGALGFTTGNQAGSGNVADVDATTVNELATILGGVLVGATAVVVGGFLRVRSSSTGAASSVQCVATSTADTKVGFDNAVHAGLDAGTLNTLRLDGKYDGAYANALSVKVLDATSGDAERFNLQVLRAGVIIESFVNLSMDDADERFVETVLGAEVVGSSYLTAVDLDAATTSALARPANGTYGPLTGGSDGLGGLSDSDFIGGSSDGGSTGIRLLDVVSELSLLACPGRATPAVHNAMLAYCEVAREMGVFAVLDPPAGLTASQYITYVVVTAGLMNFSEFGSTQWPRGEVTNPNKSVFGNADTIFVPPSGAVCGVYARGDASVEGGVHQAAAGPDRGRIFGWVGLESAETLDKRKRDLLYPKRINPITSKPGSGIFIDGSRSLRATGAFPSIPERRGMIFIEQSIKNGLDPVRHRNIDEKLRNDATRICDNFLSGQTAVGAFRSSDPKKAYFVDFGAALNPIASVFANRLNGRIGVAKQKPADFVVVRFSHITLDTEAE